MEQINISNVLKKNNAVAIVMPHKTYVAESDKIITQALKGSKQICYISLSTPYQALINKYKGKNIFFIDTVTKQSVSNPKLANNVAYVSSQTAHKELKKAIDNAVKKTKSDLAVFDSLSTLFIFQKGTEAINFSHLVSASVSNLKCKILFICIEEDMDKPSLARLGLFVDKIYFTAGGGEPISRYKQNGNKH